MIPVSDRDDVINNLSFQSDIWPSRSANIERLFYDKVIKNSNRVNKPDSETFSTWNHPLGDKAIKEKQDLINNYNFYQHNHEATYKYDNWIGDYWINELNNSDLSVKYTNIATDMVFMKAKFQTSDLKSRWPALYNAIQENNLDEILMLITTKVTDSNDTNDYYYNGYPQYNSENIATQRENGYDYEKNKFGKYYRKGKLWPNFDNELFYDRWPNNTEFDYIDIENTEKSFRNSNTRIPAKDNITHDLAIYCNDVLRYWTPYLQEKVDNVLLKRQWVQTDSDYINDFLSLKKEWWLSSYGGEYYASSSKRGMIQKYYSGAKKHCWETNEYLIGATSGSPVINSKFEIMGIISSGRVDIYDVGIRNGIFESFVQTTNNITKSEKKVLSGLIKKLESTNTKTTLYNKN